jgi:hypothetical protein
VGFDIAGERLVIPVCLLQGTTTGFEGLPVRAEHLLQVIKFPRGTVWRWNIIENFMYLVILGRQSVGWAMVLAATLYAVARTPTEAGLCVLAVRRILEDVRGPFLPKMIDCGCWEIWRGFNSIYDVMRDEISLELAIHVETYFDGYYEMWVDDRRARKQREESNGQLERGFCERVFDKEFSWWSAERESYQLKMELGMSPYAAIKVGRSPPGALWKPTGYGGWYERQPDPSSDVSSRETQLFDDS